MGADQAAGRLRARLRATTERPGADPVQTVRADARWDRAIRHAGPSGLEPFSRADLRRRRRHDPAAVNLLTVPPTKTSAAQLTPRRQGVVNVRLRRNRLQAPLAAL